MRKLLELSLAWLLCAGSVFGQALYTESLTVTNSATNIVVHNNVSSVVLRENSASCSAVYSVTPLGQGTAVNEPACAEFQFLAGGDGHSVYASGQLLGTIVATTAGPFTFVLLESNSASPQRVHSGAASALTGLTQAWQTSGSSTGGVQASPTLLDALAFDPTPASPSQPCQDLVIAETTAVRGNYAIPDSAVGVSSGTPFPCPINPLITSRNGIVNLFSGTAQAQSSFAVPGSNAAGTGPTNIFGTGHSGGSASGGPGATWIQATNGMSLAQVGAVAVVPASSGPSNDTVFSCGGSSGQTFFPSAACTGSPAASGVNYAALFNTSWVGLNFCAGNISTGVVNCERITAVSQTGTNGIPCANACTLTLAGVNAWGGTTAGTNYFIQFPGTVQISNTNPPVVTGTGTFFDSSWVGATFTASGVGNQSGLCGAAVCQVASVTNSTSMTLTGTSWSGSTSAGLGYSLGTVYGPLFTLGQSYLPAMQGYSAANFTLDGALFYTRGANTGITDLDFCWPQEQSYIDRVKAQSFAVNGVDFGCGGFYNAAANSGPVSNMEIVAGSADPTLANPSQTVVSSVSNSTLIASGPVYPAKVALAIYNFSAAPVPNIARGQLMICAGIANGTSGTVYNGNFQVMDQLSPTSALVFIPTSHASDSSTGGGKCSFFPMPVRMSNHPFYRGKGLKFTTVNVFGDAYSSTKQINGSNLTYNGASASSALPVGFEIAGGVAAGLQGIFAQGADWGCVAGEIGPIRGATMTDLDCGGGGQIGSGTGALYISSQFPVGPANFLGVYGTTGIPTPPNTTLQDAWNSNTFLYGGASGTDNPDIGFYLMDRNSFPFTNAICNSTDTCTNLWAMNGINGLSLYKGSTTPLMNINMSGVISASGNKQILTADSSAISATTPSTATIIANFTGLNANTNYTVHCSGTTIQSTAGAGIGLAVAFLTTAPTNAELHAEVATSATAIAYKSTGSIATTTPTAIYTGSTGTITTQLPWSIDGAFETGATAPANFEIGVYTINSSDTVVAKRDTYCTIS